MKHKIGVSIEQWKVCLGVVFSKITSTSLKNITISTSGDFGNDKIDV